MFLLLFLIIFINLPQTQSEFEFLFRSKESEQRTWTRATSQDKLELVNPSEGNFHILRSILLSSGKKLLTDGVEYTVEIGQTSTRTVLSSARKKLNWPVMDMDDRELQNPGELSLLVRTKTNKCGGFTVKLNENVIDDPLHIRFLIPGQTGSNFESIIYFNPRLTDEHLFRVRESYSRGKWVAEGMEKMDLHIHMQRGLNKDCAEKYGYEKEKIAVKIEEIEADVKELNIALLQDSEKEKLAVRIKETEAEIEGKNRALKSLKEKHDALP